MKGATFLSHFPFNDLITDCVWIERRNMHHLIFFRDSLTQFILAIVTEQTSEMQTNEKEKRKLRFFHFAFTDLFF